MSAIEDIAAYLQAEGIAAIGTDLFMSRMPDQPERCINIVEYDNGASPELVMQGGVPVLTLGLQTTVRGVKTDSVPAVRTRAMTVWNTLNAVVDMTIGGTYFQAISPVGVPDITQWDDEDRIWFGMNHTIVRSA